MAPRIRRHRMHSSVAVGVLPRRRFAPAFAYRDFRLLWIGLTIALTGFWAHLVALGWLVLRLTDSPFMLGLATSAAQLPLLLFGLLGGALADRLNRRGLIIFSRLVTAGLMVLLAVLTFTNLVQVWHVFVIAFLTGLFFTIDLPSRQAMIPELVPEGDLMNALSLTAVVLHGSRIVGPAIAGVVVGLGGEGLGFALYAVGNLIFVTVLLFVRGGSPPAREQKSWVVHRDILEGLQQIRANGDAFALVLLAGFLSVFGMVYFALMPVFARDVLGGSAFDLGNLMVANGVGALIGAAAITLGGDFKRKGAYTLVGSLLFGVFLVFFSQSESYLVSVVLLALVGTFMTVYITVINALLFILIPSAYHGRVMSVLMLTWGFSVFGNTGAGALAEVMGAPFAVAVTGLCVMGATLLIALYRPSLRRL